MKKAFKEWNPKPQTVRLLSRIMDVVERFQSAGYRLTLRQLYYQLVAKDIIANRVQEYNKIGDILGNARLAGLVDWKAIEDRVRRPQKASEWDSIPELMESAFASFRLPRHQDQDNHIELWTEKDALTSVLKPITDNYHVTLMVNRGYSSISAMYDAYRRLQRMRGTGKACVILYLGDHDPSGLDMDRDINERLNYLFGTSVEFERIGLTMEQIDELNPPPNPAKVTDPRAQNYIAEHGESSWEVDALNPEDLNRIVKEAIERYMDMDKYQAWKDKEERDKERLRDIIDSIDWDEETDEDDEE